MSDPVLKSAGDLEVLLEDDPERRGQPRAGESPHLAIPIRRVLWTRHDSPAFVPLYRVHVYLQSESEGGCSVRVGELPGAVSQGETVDEALAMIREAVAAVLEEYKAEDRPVAWVEDTGPRDAGERTLAIVVNG